MALNSFGRIVRYINYLSAIVLAATLVLVWWYVWRPLPRTSGSIDAPIAAAATAARDELGVPHIRAANIDDALFLQGYCTAQDRLFQMDYLRRFAGGNLAEVVGPAGLEADRDARRLRMRRIAEAAYASLRAGDRTVLAAYARGVNYFIRTHLNQLPIDFTLIGYQPRP